MKLQLDTTEKVIRVEEPVNLGEFLETIERLLPNETWKGFKLETNTTINWGDKIIIEKYPTLYPYYPIYPWWRQPIIYYKTGVYGTTGDIGSAGNYSTEGVGNTQHRENTLVGGTYNIEIQ